MLLAIKWLRRGCLAGIVLCLVIISLVSLTPQGRSAFKAALFVSQVLEVPIKPQKWFVSDPIIEEVHYTPPHGQGIADIYRINDDHKRAGLLLFLGVNPAGRNDARVRNLGNALARAGFVVMVPWSESMIEKRIDIREIDNLISAFQYLQGQEFIDADRVGMAGFCVGASMLAVAASHPSINRQVNFLNFFGGYYDAQDLLKQISARTSFYNSNIRLWEPNSLTMEVFTNQLIQSLENPMEKELLNLHFNNKLNKTSLTSQQLSSEAYSVFQLLSGSSLETTDKFVKQLPANLLTNLNMISPSTNIQNLLAKVLIMHDREDDLVPSEEAHRFADALEQRGDFHYTEFSFFDHIDPTRKVRFTTYITESVKLYRHMYKVVRFAN